MPLPTSTLGVVTVTFNAAPFIADFLECCLAQKLQLFELLIIDNASSDRTLEVVESITDGRVNVIANDNNVGYSQACNQAIHYFDKKRISNILFINNDTVFDALLFNGMMLSKEKHRSDAITPRISYADDPSRNWYSGGRLTYWKGFQGEHINEGAKNNESDTTPRKTPCAPGCCVLFDSNVFKRTGLFDPNFFVYGEDTDLFIRMSKIGMSLLYEPNLVIAHKVSLSTGGPQSDFSIHYYHRNQIYLIRKHLGWYHQVTQPLIILTKAIFRLVTLRDKFRHFALRLKGMLEGYRIHT